MIEKPQMIIDRPVQFDYSKFDRTGNKAIDLTAECIGYYRAMMRPVKSVYLTPRYFDLFVAGMQVLMIKAGQAFDPNSEWLFDGVMVKKASPLQFDSIRAEFYELPKTSRN